MKKINFKTEIVTGECDACKLKINGVIKYIKVNKHTDLSRHGEEV